MKTMTVSQALRLVSKLKGQLAEQLTRAVSSVKYEEKNRPAFDFHDSLKAAAETRDRLIQLESAILVSNATEMVQISDNKFVTVAYAVRALQELRGQIKWFKDLIVAAQTETFVEDEKYARVGDDYKMVTVEKKTICVFTEAEKAKAIETTQDEFDSLNSLVEAKNHQTVIQLDW